MAIGLRQREVRLDLAAVVPAILCLTTYPATVRSVTMPYALRSVIPTGGGDVAQPGTRILGAQQDPCVIGQETASSPRTLTNTFSRNILLLSSFRCKGRRGDSGRSRPGCRVSKGTPVKVLRTRSPFVRNASL